MRTTSRSRAGSSFRYSPLVAALACALAPAAAHAGSYPVSNGNTSGLGSFAQAILDANADINCGPGSDITFSGPFTIAVTDFTLLPGISCEGLVIDGKGSTIDGSAYTYGSACGIDSWTSSPVTVKDFTITGFNYTYGGGHGLCGNVLALGNRIHNNNIGISLSSNAQVGDGTPGGRNAIYGNETGVYVSYGGTVDGNFIGTPDGTTAMGNITGIEAYGPVTVRNNVISGNDEGIYLNFADQAVIANNTIGMNAGGAAAMPNDTGLIVTGSYGGPIIEDNLVSGNLFEGIVLSNVTDATIRNNRVGTNAVGGVGSTGNGVGFDIGCFSTRLAFDNNTIAGNLGSGIRAGGLSSSMFSNNSIFQNGQFGVQLGIDPCMSEAGAFQEKALIGANFLNTFQFNAVLGNSQAGMVILGDSNTLSRNTVTGNLAEGVRLSGGIGNRVTENSIHGNAGKNLSLDLSVLPLANDPGDSDTTDVDNVANDGQNHPVITSVTDGGLPTATQTVINFTLDTVPAQGPYVIEAFGNPAAGAPAGQTFLGATTVTVSGPGAVNGSLTIPGVLADHVTLTATSPLGDTSEFSPMASIALTPNALVTPASVTFGSVPAGTVSAEQAITVRSVGNAPLQITGIGSTPSCTAPICSGEFLCSTTCGSTPYAPNQSCNIKAKFAPTAQGTQTTTVYICDNTSASPRAVTLSGDGTPPPPITLSPLSHDFGSAILGSFGPVQRFTLTNNGSVPQSITRVAASGEFGVTANECGASVPPAGSCGVDVAFTSRTPGPVEGILVVEASGQSISATLKGNGLVQANLELPGSIDLGSQVIGNAPLQSELRLVNSGNAVLALGGFEASAPFTVTEQCPDALAPGESCLVHVGFNGTVPGIFSGTLTIQSNAPGGPRVVSLSALAQARAMPVVQVQPLAMGFGDRTIGTQTATQRVTLTNVGGLPAALGEIGTAGLDFVVTGTTCTATLASGASCYADVAMRPIGFGPRIGSLTFTSNDEAGAHAVTLGGTGCRPFAGMGNRFGNRQNCAP